MIRSASGLSIKAFAQSKVDAWGIENNHFIYSKNPHGLRTRNVLADVRDIPFEHNFFDFVYDTCLCYVPECGLDNAIRELRRVTRCGILHGSAIRRRQRRYELWCSDVEHAFGLVRTL
jgi:SAM-dependent methyltransferase